MSKQRRLAQLNAERAARQAPRDAVYAALQGNRLYQRAWALKDALGARWNRADAYGDSDAARLLVRFQRACQFCTRIEDKALRAAGLTP